MRTKRGIVYADPYKMLRDKQTGVISYHCGGNTEDFEEVDASLDDLAIRGNFAFWGNNACILAIKGPKSYEEIKGHLVKLRYTNDDQIAIMLNSNEDDIAAMQAWRSWAAAVAAAIVEKLNSPDA